MRLLTNPLSREEIQLLKKSGDYFKLTIDLENEWMVIGSELHADGEQLLLRKGGLQDHIWGGGINLKDKIIDTTAVLNIRPRLGNDNLEILDSNRRNKFIYIVKKIFAELWI